MKRKGLILLMAICLLALPARAEEAGLQESIDWDGLQRALPADTPQLDEYIAPESGGDLSGGVRAIWEENAPQMGGLVKQALQNLGQVLVILALCSAAAGLVGRQEGTQLAQRVVTAAGAVALLAALLSDWNGVMELCRGTLEQVDVFSKAMLPVMAYAIACSGSSAAGAVLYSITAFALDGAVTLVTRGFLPLLCVYLVLSAVNAAVGEELLDKLCQWIRWLIAAGLKVLLSAFVAFLSLSGILAGQTSAAVVKTAKFAISGGIPVVGKIISDATETFFAGAALVKNALGVLGMLGIVAICLVPLCRLGINYVVFKTGSALLSPLAGGGLGKLVERFGDAFALAFGMVGACAAILFFEMVLAVALVVPQ